MDIFSKRKRSEIMSRIKGKNTLLERNVFRFLRSNKIYFQKHYAGTIGKPDIAVPGRKLAVFIDSDFWHGWRFKKWEKQLATFWKEKISKNIERDKRVTRKLRGDGWGVLRVWEHQLKVKKTLDKIRDFLKK